MAQNVPKHEKMEKNWCTDLVLAQFLVQKAYT